MITALTITTQDIEFLRARLEAAPIQDGDLIRHCVTALEYEWNHWTRDDRCINARGICAAVINAEELPRIELVRHEHHSREFKLVGGKIADEWATQLRVEPKRVEPWCRITVGNRQQYVSLHERTPGASEWRFTTVLGDLVSSFGGEVWPAAWPALFECSRGTAQSGPQTKPTKLGRELLIQACIRAKDGGAS